MIVNNRIPKLTVGYVKRKIVDQGVWSDLYLNTAKEKLELAIRRHLSGLGANVADQVFRSFQVTDEVLSICRKKYRCY